MPQPPASPPRRSTRSTVRRQDVLRAAMVVIGRDGLDDMSLRAIAAEMDCSTGVLTHHFRDKAALIDFVLEEVVADIRHDLEKWRPKNPHEVLEEMLLAVLPHDAASTLRWRVLLAFTGASLNEPSLRKGNALRDEITRNAFIELFGLLRERGQLRDDLDFDLQAEFFVCLVDGLAMHALLSPKRFSKARLEQIVRMYVASIKPATA